MALWNWLQSISCSITMSKIPSEALNDWGHNDLDGFANYIGTPIQHIKKIVQKNQKVIDDAKTEVDTTEQS